jgi:hypothetical protein
MLILSDFAISSYKAPFIRPSPYKYPWRYSDMDDDQFQRLNDPVRIPRGEYKVTYDGKILGVFPTLMEAQAFQSTLGYRGSTIKTPDLRKKMSQMEIDIARRTADEFGKDRDSMGNVRS